MTDSTPKIVERSKDGSFSLHLTISKATVHNQVGQQLQAFRAKFRTDGFRPGKAPLNVVEQHYSQSQAIQDAFPQLVGHLYSQKIKELDLHPVIPPHVQLLTQPLTTDKDWEIKLTSCELPQIQLSKDLTDQVKKINSQQKKNTNPNEHLNQIIGFILKTSQLQLPQVLLDHEVEHQLSRLVDQVNEADLTVNQYLASKKTTLESYKQVLQKQIWEDWCLNLTVQAIALREKLQPQPKDVDTLIAKTPHLSGNTSLAQYILTQQAVFDWLKKL